MTVYAIQAASFNGSAVNGCRGVLIDRGWDHLDGGADGSIHETLHAEKKVNPSCEIRTLQIGSILALLNGSTDLPTVVFSGSGASFYGAQANADQVGYSTSTGATQKWNAALGMAFMSGWSWTNGNAAEASIRCLFRSSSGATDPLAQSLVTLPSLPTPAEAWAVSSITVGGVAVTNLLSARLSIDPKMAQVTDYGLAYPTQIYGAGPNGLLEIRLEIETSDQATIGTGITTGDVIVTMIQFAQGGVFSATTKTFTLKNCLLTDDGPVRGSHGSPTNRRWTARPRYDGSNKPLSWV
jgi:hypothetical protein